MEVYEISWTKRAANDLRKIYNFNVSVIGEEKAFGFILLLLERVDMLSDKRFVKMGAVDEEFKHLKRGYKKLIEGDIKITYRISATKSVVYINRVFDTRQDPRKTDRHSLLNRTEGHEVLSNDYNTSGKNAFNNYLLPVHKNNSYAS